MKPNLFAHIGLAMAVVASLFFATSPSDTNTLHIGAGLATAVLLFWHLLMTQTWLKHASHAVRGHRAGDHTKRTYVLALFTFKIWFLAVLSGLLLAVIDAGLLRPIEGLGTAHGYSAMTGTVLLVACVISHWLGKRDHQKRAQAQD